MAALAGVAASRGSGGGKPGLLVSQQHQELSQQVRALAASLQVSTGPSEGSLGSLPPPEQMRPSAGVPG